MRRKTKVSKFEWLKYVDVSVIPSVLRHSTLRFVCDIVYSLVLLAAEQIPPMGVNCPRIGKY
jgi:hypothetical protein